MALSPAAQAAKAKIDAQLGNSTELINLSLGLDLYKELFLNGELPDLPYKNLAFPGHAFNFPSYGPGRFTIWDRTIGPYEFAVGKGGIL